MKKKIIDNNSNKTKNSCITKEQVIEALKTVLDPDIGMDLWKLGMIYKIEINKDKAVITMTLTSPMCPYGPQLMSQVEHAVKNLGFKEVKVDLVFEPMWQPSEDLKMELGLP